MDSTIDFYINNIAMRYRKIKGDDTMEHCSSCKSCCITSRKHLPYFECLSEAVDKDSRVFVLPNAIACESLIPRKIGKPDPDMDMKLCSIGGIFYEQTNLLSGLEYKVTVNT